MGPLCDNTIAHCSSTSSRRRCRHVDEYILNKFNRGAQNKRTDILRELATILWLNTIAPFWRVKVETCSDNSLVKITKTNIF